MASSQLSEPRGRQRFEDFFPSLPFELRESTNFLFAFGNGRDRKNKRRWEWAEEGAPGLGGLHLPLQFSKLRHWDLGAILTKVQIAFSQIITANPLTNVHGHKEHG